MFENASNPNDEVDDLFGDAAGDLDLDPTSTSTSSPFHRALAVRLNELQIVGCNRCVIHLLPSGNIELTTCIQQSRMVEVRCNSLHIGRRNKRAASSPP